MNKYIFLNLIILPLLFACSGNNDSADAYGNFEAVEIIVSSEGTGKLLSLVPEEGDVLKKNEVVGLIDTFQLYLKKQQLFASIQAIGAKTQDVDLQIDVFQKQKANLLREKIRVEKLLQDSAATTKQYDDILGEIDVVEKKIKATKSQLNTSNRGLMSEVKPIEYQIRQLEDQISKCVITNPSAGTVLSKYAYEGEVTGFSKPLYKIADLSTITLRAYVSGDQLSEIAIGQNVQVKIDQPDGDMKTYEGKISWISSTAEFTPKVIQTRDERVNMVYAFKIRVKNDGSLKIGMPGEVFLK